MYIKLGNGIIFQEYAYFDLNRGSDFVADSLFYKRKIPIHFGEEMSKNGDKYKIIFCKVRKKYTKLMEDALNEVPSKMNLLGYTDYEDYCKNLLSQLDFE